MLEREAFPVDLQLRPFLMNSALKMMDKVPDLKAVIDHIAKPEPSKPADDWSRSMQILSEFPNMHSKVSGFVPEWHGAPWTVERIKPYVSAVMGYFGCRRLLFGSDWPVCLLSATYDQVYDLLDQLLPADWTEDQRNGVWGDNAIAFYNLNESR